MKSFCLLLAATLAPWPLSADVTLPAVFSDHMVLQQAVNAPVWGSGSPGERIEVSFGDQRVFAEADQAGRWSAELAPLRASSEGRDLLVKGSNEIRMRDVLVGEVWLCSGQSNMEWGLGASYGGKEAINRADLPMIRLLSVERVASLDPAVDLQGKWEICSPETIKKGRLQGFSAVGYYFAREIYTQRKVPVGIIQAAWGGTSIAPWIPLASLEKEQAQKNLADKVNSLMTELPEKREIFSKELTEWEKVHQDWKSKQESWKAAVLEARQKGRPEPEKTEGVQEPKKPIAPENEATPTALFNGMIRPLAPYAVRGFLWYQGEGNASNERMAKDYAPLFKLLISGWRKAWGHGDLPFLYVQLPSFKLGAPWPLLRESQAAALELPGTGMAVALDLNQDDNLHPQDKKDVALRLFLLAQQIAYGEKVDASGPVCESMRSEGSCIRLSFKDDSGKLVIGSPPIDAFLGGDVPPPADSLMGFEVAGSDKAFCKAKATIEGMTVVVTADAVTKPEYVRYAWEAASNANLYDGTGLPTAPFQK